MKSYSLYRWFVGNGWTFIGSVEASNAEDAKEKAKNNILWNTSCVVED